LAGEAATKAPHQKSTFGRCQQKLKQRLTLIFKVDIFSPRSNGGAQCGALAANPNDVLTDRRMASGE
jgi:hypothetical protein